MNVFPTSERLKLDRRDALFLTRTPSGAFTHRRPAPRPAVPGTRTMRRSWTDDPIAVGSLLALFPPLGLWLLWRGTSYSRDARVALTVLVAFAAILETWIAIVTARL